jgi:plastocyanin
MKRREFVRTFGVGSAGVAAASALGGVSAAAAAQHDHQQSNGPLASATVVFGAWRVDPPLDRFPNLSPRTANEHRLMPYVSKIKAGGSVSFVISGLHLILVYAPGTTMESINETLIIEAVPGVFPGFIDDPANRIYRGLDPRPLPQDRVESVTFAVPGTYLVTCAVVPHFADNMHGFVTVLP